MLAVRLLALGFGEPRRGVVGYYDLARECRGEVLKARVEGRKGDEEVWEGRLAECGVLVGNAMVEMGELEGAGRHLAGLKRAEKDRSGDIARKLATMEALVWLRVGDVGAARSAYAGLGSGGLDADADSVFSALVLMADGDYEGAVEAWKNLLDGNHDDALVKQNLAICLFYTGRIGEVCILTPPPWSARERQLTYFIATVSRRPRIPHRRRLRVPRLDFQLIDRVRSLYRALTGP